MKLFTQGFLRKWQISCFRFYHQPKGVFFLLYQLAVFTYILLALCLATLLNSTEMQELSTEPNSNSRLNVTVLEEVVFAMELTLTLSLSVEFCIKLWSIGCHLSYDDIKGRILYLCQLICIIDILILAANLLPWFFGSNLVLENMKFMQLFRLLHIIDCGATVRRTFDAVLRIYKTDILATFHSVFLGLMTVSCVIFMVQMHHDISYDQRDQNNSDNSWCWASLMYNGIIPMSWLSETVAQTFPLIYICILALFLIATGIVLMIIVEKKHLEKYHYKLAPYAARVIQSCYRVHLMTKELYHNQILKCPIHDFIESEQCGSTFSQLGSNFRLNGTSKHLSAKNASLLSDLQHQQVIFPEERGLSVETVPNSSASTDSAYNSAESSPGPPRPSEFDCCCEKEGLTNDQRLHVCNNYNGSSNHCKHKRDNSGGDFIFHLDCGKGDIPKYYQLAVMAVRKLKLLAAQTRFQKARKSIWSNGISAPELKNYEIYQISEIFHNSGYSIGQQGLSLLTKNQKKLKLLKRLELVEGKMAELDRKADLVLQLATQIGEQVILQRQEQKRLMAKDAWCKCSSGNLRMASEDKRFTSQVSNAKHYVQKNK